MVPRHSPLYDPAYEHGSCGLGFVARADGRRSREIVEQGLVVLANLAHRGATGSDPQTGDGAGLLLQVPDAFLRRECGKLGIRLPPAGAYGVGMIFLSQDEELRHACEEELERIAAEEGQQVLGWRDVPIEPGKIGSAAQAVAPYIRQVFLARAAHLDEAGFERKLYVIRRRLHHVVQDNYGGADSCYVASLSARTIVYKGLLRGPQVAEFYPDLTDPAVISALALVHSRFSTNTLGSWQLAHPYRYVAHNGEINTLRGNVNWMRARESQLRSSLFGQDIEKLRPIFEPKVSDSASFDNALELLVLAGRSLPHAVMMMIPEAWENDESMDPARRAFYQYHNSLMEPWDGPAAVVFTDGRVVGATLDRNGLRPARYSITRDGLVMLASEEGVLPLPPDEVVARWRLQPGRMLLVDTADGRVLEDEEAKGSIVQRRPYRAWVEGGTVRLGELDVTLTPGSSDQPSAVSHQPSRQQRVAHLSGSPDSVRPAEEVRPTAGRGEKRIDRSGSPLPQAGEGLGVRVDAACEGGQPQGLPLPVRQRAFGYTLEDLKMVLGPMAAEGKEPDSSMGTDTPLAVLSERPQLLFSYFKQLFAQVTNPPIDPLRESLVMSLQMSLGPEMNLLEEGPEHCRRTLLDHPILSAEELEKLPTFVGVRLRRPDAPQLETGAPAFRTATLPMLFSAAAGEEGLERAVDALCADAQAAVAGGATILILSDRGMDAERAPIPSLLATAAVHHHLVREGIRTRAGLVIETAEAREVHHFALLIGYGAVAVHPYLAFETVAHLSGSGEIGAVSTEQARDKYVEAIKKGLLKVISKMGISTLFSYCGAQIFEAVGLDRELIDRHFAGTASRIGGLTMRELGREVVERHQRAFAGFEVERSLGAHEGLPLLDVGGEYQLRPQGEYHQWNPQSIASLQRAAQGHSFSSFKEYTDHFNQESARLATLRGLFELRRDPIPLTEVEPVEEIVKRFSTGAMSFGSLSREAHETLAIAMNRIGGKSNTGEGGEEAERAIPDANGDSRRSAIKQVASARFGVTAHYLVSADVLQIKMAQGSKPGEGGQLPGHKVSEDIARVRHSTPGVGLISPPPHHDIYSIEDLAQLIHDLKNVNPEARVSVKLVSEVGVGTIAAGVAKAKADHITIAGHDGGTGASPLSSIKHAGLPWELGLAETQQVLVQNDLRGRVRLQADGHLKTGRDVVIAALLGAEEFAFSTAPLVATGCIMMRACHLNTCPVGIATQNPELRKKFAGKPEHVINYFFFLAEEVRELMAELGFQRLEEMVGRADRLEMRQGVRHWKARGVDLSGLLYTPDPSPPGPLTLKGSGGVAAVLSGSPDSVRPAEEVRATETTGEGKCDNDAVSPYSLPSPTGGRGAGGEGECRPRHQVEEQDHGLEQALDHELIEQCRAALANRQRVRLGSVEGGHANVRWVQARRSRPLREAIHIRNTNRSVGAMLSGEIARRYGPEGLPDDTIQIAFQGTGGQSFGAWAAPGLTLILEGETNDYTGKGLSGGKLVVAAPPEAGYDPERSIVVGNVALYGATDGEAYIRGVAGERFAVRNSGAQAVVEGVGDHGCEYMTGGVVVVLGPTGRNFAAGMSGGMAFVLDMWGRFEQSCNTDMVALEPLTSHEDVALVQRLLTQHVTWTGSTLARRVLAHWTEYLPRFTKVMPHDLRRVLEERREDEGIVPERALQARAV